jgi:Mg-chelatase subunit ChlD
MSTSTTIDVCAICLQNAQSRGGEFLVTPGCCGKWYHQSCILEMQKRGENFCPGCRAPFPPSGTPAAAIPPPAPVSAPHPIHQHPIQQQQVQYQQQLLNDDDLFLNNNSNANMMNAPAFHQLNAPNAYMRNNNNIAQVQTAAPVQQQQQPKATGFFSRLFGGRSSTTNNTGGTPEAPPNKLLQEDEVTPDTDKKPSPPSSSKSTKEGSELTITLSPEFTEEKLDAKAPFHVRVSTLFDNSNVVHDRKTDLDVVCVLDVSGSMSGSKINNLKHAMEFVITSLGERDRLSIVTFNSDATPLHGLWKMNTQRKEESRAIVERIDADGGTTIYVGMQQGWNMLTNRKTKNPASCMFLLTDGQDPSNLEEKKALAKTMRDQGTALFIFGFGNDHDAAHLIQIANAGEGSFIYVETNDTVIDAFGGAIGTQQGQLLKDIQVNITIQSPNVTIQNILAGSYLYTINPSDHRSANVTFADLYGGERRDFLIQLSLPQIAEPQQSYSLLTASANYKQHGQEDKTFKSNEVNCSIRRIANEQYNQTATHERDVEVDAQIQRLEVTQQMKSAIELADKGKYEEAQSLLANTKTQVSNAVSYRTNNPMILALLDDIKDCEGKVKSSSDYESQGGRAYMNENLAMHSKQRVVYSKKAAAPMSYQSAASKVSQSSANNYKMSLK